MIDHAPSADAPFIEVVNAFQDGDSVVLLSRRADGSLAERRVRAEYVSFVDKDVSPEKLRALRESPYVLSLKEEGAYHRVRWGNRFERERVHDERGWIGPLNIPSYEGDVNPVRRLISDSAFVVQAPRRAYLDIETDSRVPLRKEQGDGRRSDKLARVTLEGRILSWALTDEHGNGEAHILDEFSDVCERDLMECLFEAMRPFDQIVAWYGDGFDFQMIRGRREWHGMRVDMRRWLFMDHLELYKKIVKNSAESGEEKTSFKLDDVAHQHVGIGKRKFDSSKTWDAWSASQASREALLDYNVQDTALLPAIERKTGYLAMFDAVCKVCNVFPETPSIKNTRQLDGYMLRLGATKGKRFRTKTFDMEADDDGKKYKGAYVMKPAFKRPADGTGIIRNVHVCDFASLYPSIIVGFNMSPDTKASIPVNGPIPEGSCRLPTTGQGFRTGFDGILPEAVLDVLKLRKFWNDKKASCTPGTDEWHSADRLATAYKTIANAFYGVVGTKFSRFFDVDIAQGVTLTGQWLIKSVLHAAEARGMDPGYSDTDSALISGCTRAEFESFVAWCNEEMIPKLMSAQGCVKNPIKLAYEKEFARFVMVQPKMYIGAWQHYKGKAATKDSKPEVKGLAVRRGDSNRLARILMTKVVDLFREDVSSPEPYAEIVKCVREAVRSGALPKEAVQITKGLSKPLKDYARKTKKDGTPAALAPHVEVAHLIMEDGGNIDEGAKVTYFVSTGEGKLRHLPIKRYDGSNLDRLHLWNTSVWGPSKALLEAMFPAYAWKVFDMTKPRAPKRGGSGGSLEIFAGSPELVTRGMKLLSLVTEMEDPEEDEDDEDEDVDAA